jgi:hypothetical protein
MKILSAETTQVNDKLKTIEGCGLVLLAPYLTYIFGSLNLLRNNDFKDDASRAKAIAMMHYAIYGTENSVFDSQFYIPYLFCNLAIVTELSEPVSLTQEEITLVDQMLLEITHRCSRLKNASLDAIRENFIQRNGRLTIGSKAINIRVQKRVFDILLEDVFQQETVVTLPWLDKSLHIYWRV